MAERTSPLVAIASGKGGTGKTTVATSLATKLAQSQPVSLVDCDVEEPNCHLLLGIDFDSEMPAAIPSVSINLKDCTGCGECEKVCRFNALSASKAGAILFADMCHGCMGCVMVCPTGCITETPMKSGVIRHGKRGNLDFYSGLLDVGRAMAAPLIRRTKEKVPSSHLTLYDAPPGTSCAMIETVRETDFTILVTEPTPFGLNDLTLAVAALRELSVPFGVVINRDGMGDDRVEQYCQAENVTILAKIPDSREVAETYSRGVLPYGVVPAFTEAIDALAGQLLRRIAS